MGINIPVAPPQTLDTARLHLRPPCIEDAEEIFARYATDPHVARYMTWEPHRRVEETISYLYNCVSNQIEDSEFHWVILTNDMNNIIGMVRAVIQPPAVNIGYGLAQSYWGLGLMPETLAPIIGWSLSQSTIFRIWALCDVENTASIRVLEKVGMQCEGRLRQVIIHPNISGSPRDAFCYARVKYAS